MLDTSKEKTFSKQYIDELKLMWDNSITSMVHWYRAAIRGIVTRALPITEPQVKVPTYIIWGEDDIFLHSWMAATSAEKEYCKECKLIYVKASHWVPEEIPTQLNTLIHDWIKTK